MPVPRMGETMILLTRLNGTTFAVNPDLVERIQEQPDTTVVLVDGTTFIVTETIDEVIDEIAEYRARVIALAHSMHFEAPAAVPASAKGPRRFGVVDGAKAPVRPVGGR
ncbi:flagellar FlbD family protein [Amnibacterium kyonggiense]|uniref:flagellar FlbD family protein n=1 Tax=Amnibacterium kyonggiense TaxID=595671 RepID=UPI001FE247D3|nr:flagellar FlbD family protein [Amnibacterium kyonggiense]